jgi:hypothetical protein
MQSLGKTDRNRKVGPVNHSRKQRMKPKDKSDFPEEMARSISEREQADWNDGYQPESETAQDPEEDVNNLSCDHVQIESINNKSMDIEKKTETETNTPDNDQENGKQIVHIDLKI